VVTEDGSPAAHFEHTVAITAAGPRVLTAGGGQGSGTGQDVLRWARTAEEDAHAR